MSKANSTRLPLCVLALEYSKYKVPGKVGAGAKLGPRTASDIVVYVYISVLVF